MPLVVTSVMTKGILYYFDNMVYNFIIPQLNRNINFQENLYCAAY